MKAAGGKRNSPDLSIRTPFYHPDFPAIIMWSEKAACTVIAKWFFHHIGLLDEALAHAPWIHKYENTVFKAKPNYKRDCLAAMKAGKPIIKFTRNPYARAYSGYLETCNKRVLRRPNHWSTLARASVLEALTGSSEELEYAYSFVQFSQWMAKQNAQDLDLHIAPQLTELERHFEVQPVQLESLENGLCDIEAGLKLTSTEGLDTIHTSGHHHKKKGSDAPIGSQALEVGLPIKRAPKFSLVDATPGIIIASQAGPVLQSIFRMDFDAYGYD